MALSPLQRLLEIGFEIAGEWRLDDAEPEIELERYNNAANVLYAFASDEELLYIGRSRRALRYRMAGYVSGGPPRSTRERNRERIMAMLMVSQPVDVYAMPDPGNLFYGSFRVNLAAGLQHSLIEALSPPWNKASTRAAAPLKSKSPPRSPQVQPAGIDEHSEAITDLTSDRPGYRFLVSYHFMSKGFFNVPLRYAGFFGDDQQKIRILCGRERDTIHGHIDRSANTNAAPRVVGGRKLKAWFEHNTGLNNPVDIDILAPNAIWLRNPGTRF